ncbi:MAG: ATP-binding protein [Chitinophagales bacterium]
MEETKNIIRKVAITGPESSGKTGLASALAEYYATMWVPEVARSYQLEHGIDNSAPVIEMLAQQQFLAEYAAFNDARHYLFCDTDALNFMVWLEYFNYEIPLFIKHHLQTYDIFLLMMPDLPWVHDGLRRNEHDRSQLFLQFEKYLKQFQLPYYIISGEGNERIASGIAAIESYFSIA